MSKLDDPPGAEHSVGFINLMFNNNFSDNVYLVISPKADVVATAKRIMRNSPLGKWGSTTPSFEFNASSTAVPVIKFGFEFEAAQNSSTEFRVDSEGPDWSKFYQRNRQGKPKYDVESFRNASGRWGNSSARN
ncbi:hypothetical protein HDU97_008952 [Phlyctochytrium planicorne]|nr:hypothetical protein HDU97_008952 [Phlyctochytrium planicorne]